MEKKLNTDESDSLNEALWLQLCDTLQSNIGFHFSKARIMDLKRGIAAAAPFFGMTNPEDCARWLISEPLTKKQIQILATHLSIGETYFFRDKESFEILEKNILPQLIQDRLGKIQRIRIWSAGCSSGEEPYSIAMTLANVIEDLTQWNITILATDIAPKFLNKALLGIYSKWSFRTTTPEIMQKFFTKFKPGYFSISPKIKAMVKFSYHNLSKDIFPSVENGTNAMDIIFCRNVFLYFNPSQIPHTTNKLGQALVEGGYLFISPTDIPTPFELTQLIPINLQNTIIYKKNTLIKKYPPLIKNSLQHGFVISPPQNESLQKSFIFHKELRPNNEKPEKKFIQEAEALYHEGFYEESVKLISGILVEDPSDTRAMVLLARCYANLGHLDNAQKYCNQALKIDKMNVGFWCLYAVILEELGLDKEATIALKRALYLDQNNPLVHYSLGNLFRRQGELKKAKQYSSSSLAILNSYEKESILPESEGMTAGRLSELLQSIMAMEEKS